jgi:5-methylcytosine-specific restriction protein A
MQYCAAPGCSQLVPRGRCAAHAVQQEHQRPNFEERHWYYLRRWKNLRQQVLTQACYQCAACGQVSAALDVDHVVKHDGDPQKFWDRANLQALCVPCHSRKTSRGD